MTIRIGSLFLKIKIFSDDNIEMNFLFHTCDDMMIKYFRIEAKSNRNVNVDTRKPRARKKDQNFNLIQLVDNNNQ